MTKSELIGKLRSIEMHLEELELAVSAASYESKEIRKFLEIIVLL